MHSGNAILKGEPDEKSSTCALLLTDAERELAAFLHAVNDLFGREQAQQSSQDWIEELELMDWSTQEINPDWRKLTIAAAIRLARRVNVACPEALHIENPAH